MKIYIIVSGSIDVFNSIQLKKLKQVGTLEIISHKGKLSDLSLLKKDSEDKILALDPDSFEWDLDVETIFSIPNVKAVCTESTSFDWVKPHKLKKKNIIVCNCPGFSTDAVAEYILGMAIEVSRRLPLYIKNNWKVDWNTKPMLLRGKTVGIIGLGRIGKKVAEVMSGIGTNVIYWSKQSRDNHYKYVELDELFKLSDVLIPTLIENKLTETLVKKSLIDTLKPTAIIIGINRVKSLLDESYILEKVAKEELGGYAFEGDDAKPTPIYNGNIWALPPMAWYTKESLDNLLNMWVENIVAVAQKKPLNIVE